MQVVRTLITTTVLASLLAIAGDGEARGKAGPTGTFKNEDGTIKLSYLGEGSVAVELKTRYCKLVDKSGRAGTFVFPHVVVRDRDNKPLLVIFYQRKQIVVFGELERFTKKHCKGGIDVTGTYKRARR